MKRWLGLDFVDLAIHVFVTVCVGILMVGAAGSDEEMVLAMVFGTSAVVLAIRRQRALRQMTQEGLSTGEMTAERLAELEARVAELELAQDRVALLEERMDFSERLLVQNRPAGQVETGRPQH
ncbi:MAG TPA: hypothetical protein VFO95_08035 [Gemmatimonadales bacterium]|nr:hypothetical protein [Gemmatimonadales bacterium]